MTVGALVNTWGFGPTVVEDALPGSAAIAASRQRVGFRKLEFDAGRLRKRADVYVDLSAIAKGYAVDRLAALLAESRCGDFLVDVGGEMRVGGVNPLGKAWRIGIELPRREGLREAQRILRLSNEAIATSGDYRNHREVGGKYVSHLIDPRNGAPVEHALASVSVIHRSAMWADGYATTIGVLGPEAGLEFANLHEIDVLMIVRITFGFDELLSDTMRARLLRPK